MVTHAYFIWLLGGILAAVTAAQLLLSTKYPRTKLLVLSIPSFWGYVFGYFLLGTVIVAVISLTPIGARPTISFFPSWIFWPVVIGLVGVLAKTSMVGAMPGADHFHVAVRAFLFLFEPGLLDQIHKDEYFALRAKTKEHASRWRDLKAVKTAILANLPDPEDDERAAIERKLERKDTVEAALIYYWRLVGKRGFMFVFGEQRKPVLAKLPLFDDKSDRAA